MLSEYTSRALLDFAHPETETAMGGATHDPPTRLGPTYPLVIGGRRVTTPETFQSHNPANPSECVGNFSKASVAHVQEAVDAAAKAFPDWAAIPYEERAN